jgi:hypothetical protein
VWRYTSNPPYVFMESHLVQHRDKFTLTLPLYEVDKLDFPRHKRHEKKKKKKFVFTLIVVPRTQRVGSTLQFCFCNPYFSD